MTSLVPGGAILKDQNSPRQLRPTEVKRLNREWRRASGDRLALLLDSVSQPFNVGSIVRSAAAFRADQLWLPSFATRSCNEDSRGPNSSARTSASW